MDGFADLGIELGTHFKAEEFAESVIEDLAAPARILDSEMTRA